MAISGAAYQAQVRAYSEIRVPDLVMQAHQEAMACRDIEDAIDVGIRVYEMLNSYDPQTRSRAASGVAVADSCWDEIESAYDSWLERSTGLLAAAQQAIRRKYTVQQFERFRELVAQCQAAKDDRGI